MVLAARFVIHSDNHECADIFAEMMAEFPERNPTSEIDSDSILWNVNCGTL